MKTSVSYVILFLLLLISSASAFAQYKGSTFEKGKVQLIDKTKYKLSQVEFKDSSLTAIDRFTGAALDIPYYDLKTVKIMGENRAMWEGAAIGVVCAIAVTTVIVIEKGNPFDLEHYAAGFVRTAPFFAVVGGLVGFGIKRYDLVPMQQLLSQPEDLGQLNYGLSINLRF